MSKSLLIIFETAPFEDHRMREGLDFTLAMSAVFDDIKVAFKGDALSALAVKSPYQGQNRDFTRAFKALSHYDIDEVYVDIPQDQLEALKKQVSLVFCF